MKVHVAHSAPETMRSIYKHEAVVRKYVGFCIILAANDRVAGTIANKRPSWTELRKVELGNHSFRQFKARDPLQSVFEALQNM